MEKTISQELFMTQINNHLDETFEHPMGIYLDRNASLFETLNEISAAEASIPVSATCASLSAQVKHVTFYLNVMERYMFTRDDFQVDWGEVWRSTREVTPEEWDELRSEFKQAYKHLRERITAVENWNEERPLGGVIALIAHSAYHLGEIRQATCVLRHK